MAPARRRREPRRRPLTVLYEDDAWVVIDKPAGIPVHGGAGRAGPSVLERLEAERGERLHLAHRLDRGTAGVLLLARRAEAARAAAAAWDTVEKRYWALVSGAPPEAKTIERPLPDPDGRARAARTDVLAARALEGWRGSVVLVRITTGRLHQIRRHLAAVGHPVLMDDKHGDFAANGALVDWAQRAGLPRPKHPFLLCWRLTAPPGAGLPTPLTASWPRSWPPLLGLGGVGVDDLATLA